MKVAANPCPSPLRLSYYYAGAGLVPAGTIGYPYGVATPIPSSGRIAFSNFHGATYVAPATPGPPRSMFDTYFFGDCVSCYQSDITLIDILEKGGGTPLPPAPPGPKKGIFKSYFFDDSTRCYQSDITIVDLVEKIGRI